MNGLTLRINRAGTSKVKNPLNFHPIILSNGLINVLDNEAQFVEFNECQSIDKQLNIVKNLLNLTEDSPQLIKFLVIVYLQADIKHPIKCFLARHITKTPKLQTNFSTSLATELRKYIETEHNGLEQYEDVVSKVSSCVENFPAGSAAVKMVEDPLAEYLTRCLETCVQTLRNFSTLSPTEKSEIFTLSHTCLRLLLHIIQKKNSFDANLDSLCKTIRTVIKELTFDDDVPMDTKSLSGILYLTMHLLEYGPDSWMDILTNPENIDDDLKFYVQNEASKLCLYSAVATVIPIDRLEAKIVREKPAVIALFAEIIAISERCASESAFVLGVSRTVSQLSRTISRLSRATALHLVASALSFVWAHLEHHMDSVRHLSAQTLVALVKYSANLDRNGDSDPLNELFKCVNALEHSRKSYYVTVTSLTAEVGATAMLDRIPDLIPLAIRALNIQAVQAGATTALETILDKHAAEASTPVLHQQWILPILAYVNDNTLEPSVLNILEGLMTRAVKLDENIMNYILPYINDYPSSTQVDLKCVLILLSVYRKTVKQTCEDPERWKGLISYRLLEAAAFDASHQTRSLCLSLVVESPRSTEVLMQQELQLVLHHLRYNVNEQVPHHRQLTLATMKKLLKRVEDSYRVFLKQKADASADYYVEFVELLRDQCFHSLLPGCNYSRRSVALQLLLQCEHLQLGDYRRTWKRDYVEKLLVHLEDSYENNKALALDILKKCPLELLKMGGHSVSLDVDTIMRSLSLIKPTECVSAAYKLMLVRDKLPAVLAQGSATAEVACYALLRRLLALLREQLQQCRSSILLAAANAPLYPPLHCARKLLGTLSPTAIAGDASWSELVEEYIEVSMEVTAAVACVINNSSPEGHLPMDMGGVHLSDHGNSGGITLEDGRQVTAQMVLLCSWRSAKEMALLLGGLATLTVVGEEHPSMGTLQPQHLLQMGEHLRALLTQTQHRGAFEQAYVGLTQVVARMRRCRNALLHETPSAWLSEQLSALEALSGQSGATRRSAGLPYVLQALLGTEAQTHKCVARLLQLAAGEGQSAVPAVNSLRALFRCSSLQAATAAFEARALLLALRGLEAQSWARRNACTLLLSAMVVRVFGVQRTRDADALCSRNKMTGRIFFLRYPQLYDYMLSKLKEVNEKAIDGSDNKLRPSLYPILLLLARLYPSALEGTVSNLKVTSFVPLVVGCARSSVYGTRQLAARALVPLVPPQRYMAHIAEMVTLISNEAIKRNFCHGILLQLTRLVDARPEGLETETAITTTVRDGICDTIWILAQAVHRLVPCFALTAAYAQLINAHIWRCPDLITGKFLDQTESLLHRLLFDCKDDRITSGRDVCLSNSLYLYFVILHKYKQDGMYIYDIIERCLSHKCYDVVLTALNYLMILHKKLQTENKFHDHLYTLPNEEVLSRIRHHGNYVRTLCEVFKSCIYKECVQKALQLIVYEKNTQKYIISEEDTEMSEGTITRKLLEKIRGAPECLTHIYFESLLNFTSDKLKNLNGVLLLEVLRVVLHYGSSENGDDVRTVVVEFVVNNCVALLHLDLVDLDAIGRYELKAILLAIIATLLEDDDFTLRQKTSHVVASLSGVTLGEVVSTRAAELLREWIQEYVEDVEERISVYFLLSLLDFKSEVCLTDEVNDECRVFDQNEKYNIYLEETIWTSECAKRIVEICKENDKNVKECVLDIIEHSLYKNTLNELCGKNIVTFRRMLADKCASGKNEIINPKIQLFIDLINSYDLI